MRTDAERDDPFAVGRRDKDRSIETLRGVACILVVAYHVRGAGPSQGLLIPDDHPWARVIESLVYVRMPLFSFLSGYVYALRPLRSDYLQFVRGKARRLLIPLLVVGTVFILIQSFAPGTNADIGSETPWYLWHVVPVRHFWFLESIFWVFLVVALLDALRAFEQISVVMGVCAVAVTLDVVLPPGDNILGFRMALYLLPFFTAGLACRRFGWRSAPLWARTAVIFLTLGLVVVTQLGVWGITSAVPVRHSLIAAGLGVGACLTLVLLRRESKALAYIGGFSFCIYMVHPIGTAGTRYVLQLSGIDDVSAHMLLGIVGGLFLGVIVDLVARRFALSRLLVLGQRYRRRGFRDQKRRTR